MMKCKGTFEQAIGCLKVGQYPEARKDLFAALNLEPQSRSAWSLYVKGTTSLRGPKLQACKEVFKKYGIEWTLVM